MAISKIVPQSTGFGTANVGLQIPNISLEDRAASAANGTIFFNTSNNKIEIFSNGQWAEVSGTQVAQIFRPVITDPANNDVNVLNVDLITATPYLSLYGLAQSNAEWQLSTSPTFAFINIASTITGSNTQFQLNVNSGLAESTTYYARVRYSDTSNNSSDYSETIEFTSAGSFAINVDFLVVAGGGGGGSYYGGGGGAGGYRSSSSNTGGGGAIESVLSVSTLTDYPVTIGAGGSGGTDTNNNAANGSNSIFASITSRGGGAGGSGRNNAGREGGSGGGRGSGGTGATAPGTPGQGYAGGLGANNPSPSWGWGGGGGGGAGGVGASDPSSTGTGNGIGGKGLTAPISGTPVVRGGGGGGNTSTAHPGGGGGGAGGSSPGNPGAATGGTVNTGGGGGGGTDGPTALRAGGAGGSGVVVLRYLNAYTCSNPSGGLTLSTTTSGANNITVITAGTGNVRFDPV